jgi:hypothetical protein
MQFVTSQAAVTFAPKQTNVLQGSSRFPFEMEIASSIEARQVAYGLRGRAYAASGMVQGVSDGHFSDAADTNPNNLVILARDGERYVGTLRVCMSYPGQSLSALTCAPYYAELAALKSRATGALVEVGRMAIDPTITNTSYRTTLYASLVRTGYIAALAADASHILVTTKPDWIAFYRKMLAFEVIGEPALYPPGDMPITLLAGSIVTATKMQRAQNAFFRITDEEIASMRAAITPAQSVVGVAAEPAGRKSPSAPYQSVTKRNSGADSPHPVSLSEPFYGLQS